MPHPEPIKPTAWSPMGQARLAIATGVATAKALSPSVHPATLSRWCQGRTTTPAGRVPQLAKLLVLRGSPALTPADLGRPDLARITKEKKA